MKTKYDLIVIGGGASGQMAAISAMRAYNTSVHNPREKYSTSNQELSIAIIDRTFSLGRKILVCGAGKCNITNINLDIDPEKYYYGAEKEFVRGIFSQFGYKDITNFFSDLGIDLYLERKTEIGKLFPVTNQAKTVTELLLDEIKRNNIEIHLNTEVTKIRRNQKDFTLFLTPVDLSGDTSQVKLIEISAKKIILSAGGKTYPALGSNGTGYDLAKSQGHNIIEPVPSALPLEGKNPLSQELQGVKLPLEVTSFIEGKKVKTRTDDVMFTQYGLSGPAILNVSREISIRLNREKQPGVAVGLNFFPGKSFAEVERLFKQRWLRRPTQSVEKSLYGLFPTKFPTAILKLVHIDPGKQTGNLTSQEINKLLSFLSDYRVNITGTRGWNEAEFTAGGVDTKEVDATTLQSKKVNGLYFCGEILDVDGDVGGYNLSWAWSSGAVAGIHAATDSTL